MRVLVTGASGLLGRGIATALQARGNEVTLPTLTSSATHSFTSSAPCSFQILAHALAMRLYSARFR